MSNLIAFVNSFLSYMLVFGVTAILAGIAIFAGIKFRKHKDKKEELSQAEESAKTTSN